MANKNWIAMKPKVKKAFDDLYKQNIRAEMNFTDTLTDGVNDINDENFDGFAFYHSQDTERAQDDGDLMIAFGSMKIKAPEQETKVVGEKVVKALQKQGLLVEWAGDINSRISVYLNEKAYDEATGENRYYTFSFDHKKLTTKIEKLKTILEKEGYLVQRKLDFVNWDSELRKDISKRVKQTKKIVVDIGKPQFLDVEAYRQKYIYFELPIKPEDVSRTKAEINKLTAILASVGLKCKTPKYWNQYFYIPVAGKMKRKK